MDLLFNRRVKHFMRLEYPVHILFTERGVRGCYPDLPGCMLEADSVAKVHARLPEARRLWIIHRLRAGGAMPLPNNYLCANDARLSRAS